MPHGYPDYGAAHPKAELYAGVDLAELAARLGALPRYDRLGDVIFFEDFGGDLGAWELETDGLGAEVVVTAERKVTGSFSCRMTAGSNGERYAGIRGRFPVPYSVVYGLEFHATQHEDLDYVYVLIDIYTGTYHLAFGIRWDSTTMQNAYYNAAGGWTLIPGVLPVFYNDHSFIVSKFTFNITTMRYSRLLYPPIKQDLSEYTGYAVPDLVNRPRMEVAGRIYANALTNPVSYVDSVILTANDI